jgi:hypothetical protein
MAEIVDEKDNARMSSRISDPGLHESHVEMMRRNDGPFPQAKTRQPKAVPTRSFWKLKFTRDLITRALMLFEKRRDRAQAGSAWAFSFAGLVPLLPEGNAETESRINMFRATT